MKARTFTDSYIRNLRPKERPYKRSESARKGEGRLIVRVLPNGIKEFFYRYRVNAQDKTIGLGRYGGGRTLADINKDFREKRAMQSRTGDVKTHIQAEKRRSELLKRQGTFGQLLDAYVEALESAGKSSARQVRGLFKRHVNAPFPSLVKLKANEVTSEDITTILARMVNRGITRQVNVLRAYLRAAFQHGAEADHDPRTIGRKGVLFGLSGNPVAVVMKIAEFENVGERNLTEVELGAFWHSLDSLPRVQQSVLRLNLALAGQRPKQLLRASWPSFDLDKNTLLLKDTKGRGGSRDHLLPLTDFAIDQLKPLLELNGSPDEVGNTPPPFSSDGKRGMVLETLSKAVREDSDKLEKSQKIPKFKLRDLRRTCETMLQELNVDKEVRAHLLSHGRTAGVQGKHYERYHFFPEKLQALEKWADKLRRIIDPKRKAKVVDLASRRRK
jgi:integrase